MDTLSGKTAAEGLVTILTEVVGRVLVVTINRPHAMNSLDPETNDALRAAWRDFEQDQIVRTAVLTGSGDKAFSAGADLKTLVPSFRARALANDENLIWDLGGGLARGMHITKPVIAAVNGHCLAGGLEMALACDIRCCSPNATFSLAEPRWALCPGAGGTQRLSRSIPLSMAMEMLLTGDPIDAETALRVGLVNRIVPLTELLAHAVDLAQRIAERGPLAVATIKNLVYEGLNVGMERGLQLEHEAFLKLMRTQDAAEGYASFAEKRAPSFQGK
jgi:enoyl-CoA hydratase/carnithine racemase